MVIDANSILIVISASVLSGIGTAVVSSYRDSKAEKQRQIEQEKTELKLELKDLQIKLYQLEKDLTEWKDKYYSAIQELIEVKSELEETLIKLSLIDMEYHGNNS